MLTLVAWLALLTAALGVPVASAAVPSAQASGDAVFSTPEDAITAFFAGVAEGDFSKILQACAVDEISENFKFDLDIERLRAFMPIQNYAPVTDPMFVEINRAQVVSRIAMQVKLFAYTLLSGEDIDYTSTTLMDVDTAVKFANEVDPSRLATLQIEKIGLPSPELMQSDRYTENALKIARVYGADDSTERIALFSFEGSDYLLGFTLLRYGDNWKISSANSPMGNTSSLGLPVKTSAADFEAMTQ
jgi:hypothetical protein